MRRHKIAVAAIIVLGLALPAGSLAYMGHASSHHQDGRRSLRDGAAILTGTQCPIQDTAAISALPTWEQGLVLTTSCAWGVPNSTPAGGVSVMVHAQPGSAQSPATTELYLRPPTARSPVSETQAQADALSIDNAPDLSVPITLWANVTVPADEVASGGPASLPPTAVLGRNAWVVVVATPAPVTMQYGCRPSTPTSAGGCASGEFSADTLVIDASSGQLLFGYFS